MGSGEAVAANSYPSPVRPAHRVRRHGRGHRRGLPFFLLALAAALTSAIC
ncbi:MAG: hypothetical protein ACLTMP_13055 [Eggerthella lenta]